MHVYLSLNREMLRITYFYEVISRRNLLEVINRFLVSIVLPPRSVMSQAHDIIPQPITLYRDTSGPTHRPIRLDTKTMFNV